jgi:hypothetical protein
MSGGPNRLVKRTQDALQVRASVGVSRGLSDQDIADLADRVRRLGELDDRFTHVRISSYVVASDEQVTSNRAGSGHVAREV